MKYSHLIYIACIFCITPLSNAHAISLSEIQQYQGSTDDNNNPIYEIENPLKKPTSLPGLNPKSDDGLFVSSNTESNTVSVVIIENILYGIIDTLLYSAGTVATLFIIYGGALYVVSRGESDEGKGYVTNAVVGLVIVIMAYAITDNIIRFVLDEPNVKKATPLENLSTDNPFNTQAPK